MSSKSATTLLNVVKSHIASDVLEFTAKRKAADDDRDGILTSDENDEHPGRPPPPPSIIVVDSKMTPLEAATLLWENNM